MIAMKDLIQQELENLDREQRNLYFIRIDLCSSNEFCHSRRDCRSSTTQ